MVQPLLANHYFVPSLLRGSIIHFNISKVSQSYFCNLDLMCRNVLGWGITFNVFAGGQHYRTLLQFSAINSQIRTLVTGCSPPIYVLSSTMLQMLLRCCCHPTIRLIQYFHEKDLFLSLFIARTGSSEHQKHDLKSIEQNQDVHRPTCSIPMLDCYRRGQSFFVNLVGTSPRRTRPPLDAKHIWHHPVSHVYHQLAAYLRVVPNHQVSRVIPRNAQGVLFLGDMIHELLHKVL